ncbi:Uncharacterized protein Y057_10793 [Fusarium fujikuroi]|nr:Uncharacterized protein Y057_10793 [Fusarium fujikuroi]
MQRLSKAVSGVVAFDVSIQILAQLTASLNMQSDASAVPGLGSSADDDNRSSVGVGIGDGTGPRLLIVRVVNMSRVRTDLPSARAPGPTSGPPLRTSFLYMPRLQNSFLSEPNPSDEEPETIVVAQPAADDGVSAVNSSPSQQLQPLTPLSCVPNPVQPWVEPDVSWDSLLTSAQFLLPFSTVPSLEAGSLADFGFGDAVFPATGQLANDYDVQNVFGVEETQREVVDAARAFTGPDDLTAEEEDILIAENIPHVPPLTEDTRVYMIQAIQDRLPRHEAQGLDVNFPSLRHLDTYMQLYFEHFHPRMPLLHVPTFQASPDTWQLVLSVVCIGSRYSQAHQHHDHVQLLQRIAQHMVKLDVRPTPKPFFSCGAKDIGYVVASRAIERQCLDLCAIPLVIPA